MMPVMYLLAMMLMKKPLTEHKLIVIKAKIKFLVMYMKMALIQQAMLKAICGLKMLSSCKKLTPTLVVTMR